MPGPLIQYPVDYTGQSLDNYITGEQHILTAVNHRNYHFILPHYSPFYVTNFRIWLHKDGLIRELEEGADYLFSFPYIGASRATARPIYGAISFNNLDLSGVIVMNYQTIGGSWVVDTQKALEIAANSVYNPRVTSWEVIADVPTVFPPIPHAWDVVDMVGQKELIAKLTEIEEAILSTAASISQTHLIDFNNPHQTTKTQVGLGNVPNYSIATLQEMTEGVVNNKFVTPVGLGVLKNKIDTHISNNNNPHNMTKEDIGLGHLMNWPLATVDETLQGTQTDRYVGLQALQAKFNDFLSNVSSYVPSVALQQLQTQMNDIMPRLVAEEQKSIDLENSISNLSTVISGVYSQIEDRVKISTTNLGTKTGSRISTPTLSWLADKPNGFMAILQNKTYYTSNNIPVDDAVYPGPTNVEYSLYKFSCRTTGGVADYLAFDSTNNNAYVGFVNSNNTSITWIRLLGSNEQDNLVSRVELIENKITLTNSEIDSPNSQTSNKITTFDNVSYYLSKHLNNSYTCRAWVNFDGTGSITIRGSGNVLSITDNGVGNYTVNFAVPMPDEGYAVAGRAERDGGTAIFSVPAGAYGQKTTSVQVGSTLTGGSVNPVDCQNISVVVFR